ncbi:MAG: hypothetical protein JW915_11950 [Chitinispirillaceae bacterium]|nr:hypothetical protein [Chitinispirillaceae bacterium]
MNPINRDAVVQLLALNTEVADFSFSASSLNISEKAAWSSTISECRCLLLSLFVSVSGFLIARLLLGKTYLGAHFNKLPAMIHQLSGKLLFCMLLILVSGCSVTRFQKQGYTTPDDFYYQTTFTPFKSCVVLPAIIGNDTSNLLFDTGCQITLVQSDSSSGKSVEVTGASDQTIEMGHLIIDAIRIGEVIFHNTNAATGDYTGLKEQIPDFGGIIGQPMISKANWLIDYTTNTITISSKDLADEDFETIRIRRRNGSPFTYLNIDGKKYKTLIDLGSSKGLSIPEHTELANEIVNKHSLQKNERAVYRIGGLEQVEEYTGSTPSVQIGSIVFSNIETVVFNTNKIRIGNTFFRDCILYIDNANKCYRVKKVR